MRHVPVRQVLPAQQGSPEPPHAVQVEALPKLPALQTIVSSEHVLPSQHACPSLPQATHE
jgi:hypothetical protein